tara:strand:- start:1113 stop:2996 length:1884 start_codon:yes stop_codon:yes gene_type:complete
MPITKVGKDKIGDNAIDSNILSDNSVNADKIQDGAITNSKISGTANLAGTKFNLPGNPTDFLNSSGAFATLDTSVVDNVTFNIGVIGFKMAVNEGLTIFNLVDGVVDEFNSEAGIDTSENSNAVYNSTSDFYANLNPNQPIPSPQIGRTSITSTGSGTYSVEPTVTAVDVLVVGGGGSGGAGGYNNTAGGGGGAGGLIFYEDYPVTGGTSIPVSVGAGGRSAGGGGPLGDASTGYEPVQPQRFTWAEPSMPSDVNKQVYSPGEKGTDSVFNAAPALVLTAEGGGAGGGYAHSNYTPPTEYSPDGHPALKGGSSGGTGSLSTNDKNEPEAYRQSVSTQVSNHPVPGLSNDPLPGTPINARGAFGSAGGSGPPSQGDPTLCCAGGGGGAATAGGQANHSPQTGGAGGEGLLYNIADGSTPVGYAGGGGGAAGEVAPPNESVPFGGGVGQVTTNQASAPWAPISSPYSPIVAGTEGFFGTDAVVNTGGGSGGGHTEGPGGPETGVSGIAGSGVIIIAESKADASNSSSTLISDTFTANSTPTKARIVVFAEITDDLNTDINASATRDNTTFDAITLTDTGYISGSSGTKIFTGSTPLTGTASPQVQVRWKIVGSNQTGQNKIHGVALQWG